MCVRDGMFFPVVVPGREQNVKNCTKLAAFSVLYANNCTNKPLLNNSCATEGIHFCGLVPVRVWIWPHLASWHKIICWLFSISIGIDCGEPCLVPNSIQSGNSTLYESEVSYQCIEGYENTGGPLTRRCQANSKWSSCNPICTGEFSGEGGRAAWRSY